MWSTACFESKHVIVAEIWTLIVDDAWNVESFVHCDKWLHIEVDGDVVEQNDFTLKEEEHWISLIVFAVNYVIFEVSD